MVKLTKVVPSSNPDKKYDAFFDDGSKTSFGASGYKDYTQHHDKERRELYIDRHKKDLETHDPTRAGFLSFYILWNKPTLRAGIAAYKKMFNM
jgi:hypothetical protein